MSKLKGVKKLNKAVSAQLAPFGISKAKYTGDYAYYDYDESITYSLIENNVEDLFFKEFIKERFNYIPENSFIVSLMHEIGHHKTYYDLNPAVIEFCEKEKERINKEMINADMKRSKELEWQYFNLPDEIIATTWAIYYMETHPKKMRKMWKKCEKALHKFYSKNIN